ncbi:MAG: hypothetical protein CMJ83_20155 [Planctomycetes bacterium]|nr:hypothetical protein [Planctomycetota bacterium]
MLRHAFPTLLLVALAVSACGEPMEGAIPATPRTADERLALRLLWYREALDQADVLEVVETRRIERKGAMATGPTTIRRRLGTARIVGISGPLERPGMDWWLSFLKDPATYGLSSIQGHPTTGPERMIVVHAGERRFVISCYVDAGMLDFGAGGSLRRTLMALSESGRMALRDVLDIPLSAPR